ncbi:hypothetical protein Tco_1331978, partial [Tanacetum coccineum]
LRALANAAVIVDSNIPPGGASSSLVDSDIPPGGASSSYIHTDVPTGVAPAGVSNKGKTPMVDDDITVKERTKKETRQVEVLSSAKHYSDANWIDIMAQVHANACLSSELLGTDVNNDNFAERMSTTIYSTGWFMKFVKSLTDEQLKAEFEKIRMAVADLKSLVLLLQSVQISFESLVCKVVFVSGTHGLSSKLFSGFGCWLITTQQMVFNSPCLTDKKELIHHEGMALV